MVVNKSVPLSMMRSLNNTFFLLRGIEIIECFDLGIARTFKTSWERWSIDERRDK